MEHTCEQIGPHTRKLVNTLRKYGTRTEGEICEREGVKYRHDRTVSNPKHTPYWLGLLYDKAAAENGRAHHRQFISGSFSFYFDRSPYKGSPDGRISFTELIFITK